MKTHYGVPEWKQGEEIVLDLMQGEEIVLDLMQQGLWDIVIRAILLIGVRLLIRLSKEQDKEHESKGD
ncbi:hypothetical protein AXG93_3309s1130 [Marchantia polymorpha subsp. ruderalis]|uniref:Uncharacterized protein n=1 Tax=Marchantia polymorpha subsp. ruderalis TaxID=1480154 RepID=A0A176W708_MARPO|nr:hypothetical protein AXG93_3309s1130 [Marchantia polymorpha subsp. ruderalis]